MTAWTLVLLIALWASASRPGGGAVVLLAITLALAVGLSPLRKLPSFPLWTLSALPGATALWMVGEERPMLEVAWPAGVACLAGLLYLRRLSPLMIVLALQIAAVAYFSGGKGSGGAMVEWLLHHGFTERTAKATTSVFRKTVHFTFYGSVGWAVWRATRAVGGAPTVAVRTALLTALALAGFDELRQSGYGSRTGSAWDVLLDLAGATTFVGLLEGWSRKAR